LGQAKTYGLGFLKRALFLYAFVSYTSLLFAQKYPQDYFRYPLDSLPNLVSPFGGLRDNHFHSGIDLRTNGREGLPVYAAADGYISRIKIQKSGYGKALYIEHPNGYSTVYGHLQQYNGEIAEWIHRYQYINKTFEFDKIFMKPFLKVKKGDTIGWSGNSGGSTGPHLHYEIRDTKTEKIMNPALFGLIPYDTLDPIINKIHVYKFVTEGELLKKQLTVNKRNFTLIDSIWLYKDTLELDPEVYGFGIEAYDYIHNAKDEKGIYEISLLLNQQPKFTHTLNQFAFDESKYINAHIDFPYYKIEKARVQKCFIDDGNVFSTYKTDADKGRLNLALKKNHTGNIVFAVKDFNGNAYYLQLCYKIGESKLDQARVDYEKSIAGKRMLIPGKAQVVEANGLVIKMDPKSIYDTVFYELETLFGDKNSFSREFVFHTPNVPIHAAFDIAIEPAFVPAGLESKLVLAYSNGKSDRFRSAGGSFENGVVKGKGANFGNYCIMLDTVAPTVKWMRYKNEDNPNDTLRWDFEIKDNFTGISSYSAYLNDNWILVDYDLKNQQLTYKFDEMYFLVRQSIVLNQMDSSLPVYADLKILLEDAKGNKQEKLFNLLLK
jgi:murein DD-endopeptidase MepM/ murein hydrolase activator NlpD